MEPKPLPESANNYDLDAFYTRCAKARGGDIINPTYRQILSETLDRYEHPSGPEAQTLRLGLALFKHLENQGVDLILENATNPIQVQTGSETQVLHSEFFASPIGTEMVRVGPLFILDSRFRASLMSSPLAQYEPASFLFLSDLNNYGTELSIGLRGFTANAIASVLAADLKDKTVIDCGSGSGILSMVALKIKHARHVIGIDLDQFHVYKPYKDIPFNPPLSKAALTLLNRDLHNQPAILDAITPRLQQSMAIISNIGYWPEYSVGNLSNILLIPQIESLGGHVDTFIGAGYARNQVKAALLEQHGLKPREWPRIDQEFDQAVLKQLGFSLHTLTQTAHKSADFPVNSLVAISTK